jgi:hypothetical protein
MLHGDGEPMLICYEDESARMCYVLMKNDIAGCALFKDRLPPGEFFDCETPYGYGGPLIDGEFSESSQKIFLAQLDTFCKENGIISQFIRFHPLLANQAFFSEISENVYMRDTIYIDTSSEDIIFANLDSKNRNMIRKARKAGVQVVRRPIGDYKAFLEMYCETMRQHNADDFYYFSEEYFEFMGNALKSNATIFYAMLDNRPISGAVFLFNDKIMHYHLAGMHREYRNLAAGNLLLYEAAGWAERNGITQMHLGGGLSENDSLFLFKKQFNKNGRLPFYVGRTIFIRSTYDWLLQVRKQLDPEFDVNNHFLIQYRG